jgi:hypothetical protein
VKELRRHSEMSKRSLRRKTNEKSFRVDAYREEIGQCIKGKWAKCGCSFAFIAEIGNMM